MNPATSPRKMQSPSAWDSLTPQMKRQPTTWIWMKGRREEVDCHLLMRKTFTLPSKPANGFLEIGASDQYRLFINGKRVGDGPARSEVPTIYVDRYEFKELPLRKGKNVIALLVHNTMMPQHGQSLCPGGVWLELECALGRSKIKVTTDATWRASTAPQFAKPAPRRFFAVGFNENYLPAHEPRGWTTAGFDDRTWQKAVEVETSFFKKLIPRPVPRLVFEYWKPEKIRRSGKTGKLDGIHGLAFGRCTGFRPGKEVTFQTFVYSDKPAKGMFRFGSDQWSRVLLNGVEIWKQGDPQHRFIGHLEKRHETYKPKSYAHGQRLEDYTGMVYGNGIRMEPPGSPSKSNTEKAVALKRGWNEIRVWMYRPDLAYGFELCFVDPEKWTPIKTVASSTRDIHTPGTWTQVPAGKNARPSPVRTLGPDIRPWLEPSHLAEWDRQTEHVQPPRGAASLLSGAKKPGSLILAPGEFVEFQLPADGSGFPDLEATGPAGALVDVSISEAQTPGGRMRAMYNGLWQSDRVTLSGKRDHWQSLDRRSGRYLSLCVRHSSGPVEIHRFGIRIQKYPAAREGTFQCSDPVLNRMWEAGAASVRASSYDLVEDCPTREKAQWQQDTYIRMFLMGVLWGDLRMSAKGIREFSEDQKADRWARPCVPSGYGDKLVEGCFLLPIWIMDHYRFTGDDSILRDSFPAVKNLLDYARSLKDRLGFPRPLPDPRNIIYIDYTMLPTTRCGDTIGVMQCHYVMALEEGARQAGLLGHSGQAALWRDEAAAMREKIRHHFWVEKKGQFVDGLLKGKPGGTFNAITNYWMLLARVADPRQETIILKNLWPEPTRENLDHWPRGESPYSKFFTSEVLLRRGMWRETFTSWRGYYGHMLGHPESWCVPEVWSRKWSLKEPIPHNSLVHAYGIGPMAHLAFYIAGVRPLEDSPGSILWEPMPGDLSWLKATLPVIGTGLWVTVEWKTLPSGGRNLVLGRPRGLNVRASDRHLAPGDRMTLMDL